MTAPTPERPMRIYIAGPMTGLPDSNYPAFHAAEARLQALGHEPHNPARNPGRPAAHGKGICAWLSASWRYAMPC